MQKLKDKNQPVTSGEFQEFADFIINTAVTKDGLKNELKAFATKDDLKKELREFGNRSFKIFATKDDLKAYATRIDLEKWKDEILTSNDKIAKKLDHVITEEAAHFVGHHRMDDILLEHTGDIKTLKHRVTRLESKAGVA